MSFSVLLCFWKKVDFPKICVREAYLFTNSGKDRAGYVIQDMQKPSNATDDQAHSGNECQPSMLLFSSLWGLTLQWNQLSHVT